MGCALFMNHSRKPIRSSDKVILSSLKWRWIWLFRVPLLFRLGMRSSELHLSDTEAPTQCFAMREQGSGYMSLHLVLPVCTEGTLGKAACSPRCHVLPLSLAQSPGCASWPFFPPHTLSSSWIVCLSFLLSATGQLSYAGNENCWAVLTGSLCSSSNHSFQERACPLTHVTLLSQSPGSRLLSQFESRSLSSSVFKQVLSPVSSSQCVSVGLLFFLNVGLWKARAFAWVVDMAPNWSGLCFSCSSRITCQVHLWPDSSSRAGQTWVFVIMLLEIEGIV